MQKIIVRMRGGLGNQLFILANAYSVARQFDDYEIIIDDREYKKYKVRSFEVSSLICDSRVRIYEGSKDKSIGYELTRRLYHLYQGIFKSEGKRFKDALSRRGYLYSFREGNCQIGERIGDRIYLYGYFQDEKMASGIIDFMKTRLCIPSSTVLNNGLLYIAVSIRCGSDYEKGGWPICSEKYYVESVEYIIEKKYKGRDVTVAVFSDDYGKAEKIKFNARTVYMKGMTPIQQLAEFRCCRDFVISNSSFAWWGAFFGKTDESIIVMPDKWYSRKEETEKTFLMLPGAQIRKFE